MSSEGEKTKEQDESQNKPFVFGKRGIPLCPYCMEPARMVGKPERREAVIEARYICPCATWQKRNAAPKQSP